MVRVSAAPKASRNGVEGAITTAYGAELKVRITAATDRSKTNQPIIKLLAKTWHLPPSYFSIMAGDSGPLITRLQQWLGDPA